jgi:hypothetical protein
MGCWITTAVLLLIVLILADSELRYLREKRKRKG